YCTSRRRHTRSKRDWSSDVCSSDLIKKNILNWENDMQLPHSDILDIAHFSRLFDNKSECYKLFWFQAIARKIKEGQKTITFEALDRKSVVKRENEHMMR